MTINNTQGNDGGRLTMTEAILTEDEIIEGSLNDPTTNFDEKEGKIEGSEIYQRVTHLADVIGARPAGTEEEQQASFYIEDLLKNDAGLETEVEEFNCNANFELARTICCLVSLVLAILSITLPLTLVPALVLTIITAILYVLDAFELPPLNKLGMHGISQNVFAKYVPKAPEGAPQSSRANRRKRKIVIIAHYDSGKVRAEISGAFAKHLNIIHWIEFGAMILIPFALFIRLMSNASEGFLTFLNILVIIGAVGALLPVITYVLHQTAQYNNGANCNAAGVAILTEVAKRVGRDLPAIDFSRNVEMSGEKALRDSNLIPEGAEFSYADMTGPIDLTIDTPEDTPAPVTPVTPSGVDAIFGEVAGVVRDDTALAENTAADNAGTETVGAEVIASATTTSPDTTIDVFEAEENPLVNTEAPTNAASSQSSSVDDNLPDWFKRGVAKANENKPQAETGPTLVQRSRFADALDNAAAAAAEAEQAARQQATAVPSAVEARLQQMRESIMGQAAQDSATIHKNVQVAEQGTDATAADIAQASTEAVVVEETGSASSGPTGVDGYLSQTMDAPDYASSSTQAGTGTATSTKVAAQTAAATPATAAAQAAAQVAASSQMSEADREAAERAAIAGRTIGFIPVPIDEQEIISAAEANGVDAAAIGMASKDKTGPIDPVVIDAPTKTTDHSKNRKKREISLPSLTGAIEGLSARLQEAPLGAAAEGEGATKAEKATADSAKNATSAHTASAMRGAQSANVAKQEIAIEEEVPADTTGASGASGMFEPVSDELIAASEAEDLYIEDADDSDYVEQFTASGAPVGPGYVDMPSSRASKMFGFLRRDKKDKGSKRSSKTRHGRGDDELSLKDSLGLDDTFDARNVGKERGGWESFRDPDLFEDESFSSFEDDFEDNWEGGAFSKLKQNAIDGVSNIAHRGRKQSDDYEHDTYAEYDEYGEYVDDGFYEEYSEESDYEAPREDREDHEEREERRSRRSGSGSSRTRRRTVSPFGNLPLEFTAEVSTEREAIQQFNSGALSTEIWFVALGAELANNAGIKAFIAEHSEDLKGSVIIDLNGLGAGSLSVIEEEGMYRPVKVSARLKRYATKAANALGMRVAPAKMLWRDSAAYITSRKGYQTLHLAGILKGKPAYCAEADDVIENVSDEMLNKNTDFVMELLRNI